MEIFLATQSDWDQLENQPSNTIYLFRSGLPYSLRASGGY